MKIQKIKIHNFRSIRDIEINLSNYSLLVGENNSGKSNIFSALRIFYEEGGLKFNKSIDFPKFQTEDKESWIEISFVTTNDEQETLKKEYRPSNKILSVRKYLKSEITPDLIKRNQSNIYGYENGRLSTNLFYGAKNISQAKLGKVIYIPEISKIDESLKLSGPSPFRNILDFVIKKVVKNSKAFTKLEDAFKNFNEDFKGESTDDGFSIKNLLADINKHIEEWNISFGLRINSVKTEDIIKNLLFHYLEDGHLKGKEFEIGAFGQGFQRHLIFTLIKLSSKFVEEVKEKKTTFDPDFTLLLFEEPEAFLHPTQQEQLNISLKELSTNEDTQMMITTHSPTFTSRNIEDITNLIRINKDVYLTNPFQINQTELGFLFDNNSGLAKYLLDKLNDTSIADSVKNDIKSKLGIRNTNITSIDPDILLEEESIRYILWIDSERASSFFAKKVLICEGASEKVLIDYLLNTKWSDLKGKHISVLDAMGKFNIHRYMNLFSHLGIYHAILFDCDNRGCHPLINDFIENNKNEYTLGIKYFDTDLEDFLNIERVADSRKDKKPLNVMKNLLNKNIKQEKIDSLRTIITGILQI